MCSLSNCSRVKANPITSFDGIQASGAMRWHFLDMVVVVEGGEVWHTRPDSSVPNPAIKRCRWAAALGSFLPFRSLSISVSWTQDAIYGASPARGLLSAEMNRKKRKQRKKQSSSLFFLLESGSNRIYWSVVKDTKSIFILCRTENKAVKEMIFCLRWRTSNGRRRVGLKDRLAFVCPIKFMQPMGSQPRFKKNKR